MDVLLLFWLQSNPIVVRKNVPDKATEICMTLSYRYIFFSYITFQLAGTVNACENSCYIKAGVFTIYLLLKRYVKLCN
jgi:hypothetical protein